MIRYTESQAYKKEKYRPILIYVSAAIEPEAMTFWN